MTAPPTLTEKLANVQHMPSLIAATVASDKPTDGYLVRDVVKMSYESVQTRIFLQKYLINMLLSSRNVYVKIKVLKLFVSLLQEGHPDFHKNLQKYPESFKDAAMIKSSSPSFSGDCGRIRDLANKVFDLLYEEPPQERVCPYGVPSSSSSGNRHGNQAGLLRGGGSGGGGRIQGFGNLGVTKESQTSVTNQFTSAMGSLFGSSTKPKKSILYDENYATLDSVPQSSSITGVGGGSSGTTYQRNGSFVPPLSTGSEHHRGRPGGGWDDNEESQTTGTSSHRQNSDEETTPTYQGDNEQERKLVDEITAPGGVRAAPPKEDLKTFISRCKSLDCLSVVEFLKLKLQNDNNQILMKTLFVIEALVRSDIPEIYSFMDLILDELTHLSSSSSQPGVKAKATKLLHQLSVVQNISDTTENKETNILTVGGDEGEESKPQTSQVSGLFSGLTLSSSPETSQVIRHSPPTRKSKHVSQSSSLLEGLTISTSQPSQLPQPSQQTGGGDLLDFGEEKDLDEDFDPLKSSQTQTSSGQGLLAELSSLDEPPSSSTLPPLQPLQAFDTTPLISTSHQQEHDQQHGLLQTENPVPVMGSPSINQTRFSGLQQISNSPMIYTNQVPMVTVPMTTSGYPSSVYMTQPVGYHPSVVISNNRPVQRLPQTDTTGSDPDSSGFGFLSKSSKGAAFDFVNDEMKASMGGK